MPRTNYFLVCLLLMLICAPFAGAQMPSPKPAPELSKLDYLAGHWTSEGDLKPGPMGPGGKVTSVDDSEWMDGKFFLEMHSRFSGASGELTGLAIFGYDTANKVYTYYLFNSAGEVDHYTGTLDGDTLTWSGSIPMGDKSLKTRYVTKKLSPTAYTYQFEITPDGTSWILVMDGKATKK